MKKYLIASCITVICCSAVAAESTPNSTRPPGAKPQEIFVAPNGQDSADGTRKAPLQSFAAAQQAARRLAGQGPVTVTFADGVYYLPQTVVFIPEDSGTADAPVVYQAANERGAVLSGGVKLALTWLPYKDGILHFTPNNGSLPPKPPLQIILTPLIPLALNSSRSRVIPALSTRLYIQNQ